MITLILTDVVCLPPRRLPGDAINGLHRAAERTVGCQHGFCILGRHSAIVNVVSAVWHGISLLDHTQWRSLLAKLEFQQYHDQQTV